MTEAERELFERKPILQAVLSMVVPTVISQLITVLYNMADTFFIGQTGDPNQVAAANLCMPMFILLTGFANLFGIGGASLVSRSLGSGNTDRARHAASFSIWTAVFVSLCYGIGLYLLRPVLLPAFGVNGDTYLFCSQYLFWTVTIGAIPTVLNALLAHLIRAEGFSKEAGFGMTLGAGLNIVLDPIFISVFRLQIAGAAMATMLSNLTAMSYFVVRLIRNRKETVIVLHPKYYSVADRIPSEILLTGLPSAIMCLMSTVSNITLNRLMSAYTNKAIAGVGIAKKIDMLTYGIATGMSQGVVPLIGYNYSSGNRERMRQAIRTSFLLSFGTAIVCTVLLFTCAHPIVRAFIQDAETVDFGQQFQRIICITGPCVSITLIVITIFQSTGEKTRPMILSLLRKGGLDIPFMLLMNRLIGVTGIVWATPIADFCSMAVAILLFLPFWRSLHRREPAA